MTGFTDDVRTLVEMGRLVTGPDYLKPEQLRRVLIDDLARVFADVDVIIGPTCPLTAWSIGEWTVRVGAQDESVRSFLAADLPVESSRTAGNLCPAGSISAVCP